ncbi:MAG: alpha/beta hydrolase [Planctomycetes bacterium]|nr:alpha/beta hydrolase [Planctomycetota bacterium]
MPQVTANQQELHYQLLGEGGEGDTPCVFAHGLLVDNLSSWYFGAAPVVATKRRALCYDLRGHGLSAHAPEGYDVATCAADLVALLDALELEVVDLAGQSYGALIALRVALEHPERVRRLILCEAPLPPSRLEEMAGVLRADPAELLAMLPDSLREAFTSGKRRAVKAAQRLERLLTQTTLVSDLQAEGDHSDEVLASVQQPTLLLYGEASSCRGVGDRLEQAIPDARLVTLDGGHYLAAERAAEVGRHIQEFLDG